MEVNANRHLKKKQQLHRTDSVLPLRRWRQMLSCSCITGG